jgi:hypothetical protein
LSCFLFFSAIHFPLLRGVFSVLFRQAFAKPASFIKPMTNGWGARRELRPMGGCLAAALASLDVGTLFFIAICVTVLLGLFLLHAWLQEGNRALAWWSLAYLIGGASGVLWRFGDAVASVVPAGTSTVLLFVAVGMTWSGARSLHGRPICWSVMAFGAAFWTAASFFSGFAESAASRIVVSALIVAGYTFLTAAELRHDQAAGIPRRRRRKEEGAVVDGAPESCIA